MSTPDYIKRFQNAYNAKFDIIQIKAPKGTKDRIKAIADGQSMAGYCLAVILAHLDAVESAAEIERVNMLFKRTETGQKSVLTDEGEHLPIESEKTLKTANKAANGDNLDFLQSMQQLLNQRREDLKANRPEDLETDNEKQID